MGQLERIQEAIAAHDRGWWLTPLKGKRPILQAWSELPRATKEDVIGWATAGNVGVRTGVVRGPGGLVLVVVDVDPGAPDEFLRAFETIATYWVRTPRGGLHGYFWGPPGLRNSASSLAPHVDIRAQGGQVVCVGADGYVPITDPATIAEIPASWLDKLGSLGKLSRAASTVRNATEGTRNDTLNREAWKLRPDIEAGKISEADARARLSAASPLPHAETARTLDSALKVRVHTNERQVLAPGVHANGIVSTPLDFTKLVLSAVPQSALYLRESVLGEVVSNRWVAVSAPRLRGIVSEYVEVKYLKDQGEKGVKEERAIVTDEHAKLILENAQAAAVTRKLRAICNHVVITRDMNVLGPGWHPEYGLLITDFVIADEPFDPIGLCVDFPMDDASKANLRALFTTLAQRPCLDAPAPLFVVIAAQARVGKTKLINSVVGMGMLGRPLPIDTWPEDEDEVRKSLLSAAIGGGEVYVLDNIPRKLDSPVLASFTTAEIVAGRMLGKSLYIEIPNNLTVIATGNQVEASQEIAKRSLIIELEALTEDPEMRSGFTFPELADAAAKHHAGIQRWLIELARNANQESKLILGGFERWAKGTGRLLHAYPVLANRQKHVERMTVAEDDPAQVVAAMATLAPGVWLGTDEVLAIVVGLGWGGERLDPVRTERSRMTALGSILRHHVGRIYGRWRLERKTANSGAKWRAMPMDK